MRVDDEAHAKTAQEGLYGLMHDGAIYLDPGHLRPDAAQGRALLAHEVVDPRPSS